MRSAILTMSCMSALGFLAGCGPAKESAVPPIGGNIPVLSSGTPIGAKKTVGVSLTSRNHNFFIGMEQGVTDALKEAGYEMDIQVAEDSASKQQEQIDTFIRKHVDAIIMVPSDAKQAVTPISAANKAGIPIFCIDRRVTDSTAKVTATIETDNKAMGAEAAKFALKLLCERRKLDSTKADDLLKIKTTIIHNWGIKAASSAQDRATGFESVINKTNTPGIKVIVVVGEFNAKKSQEVMAPALRANPDVELVYCHNDDNAIGALNAIKDIKKKREDAGDPKRIFIVGMDGNKPAVDAVRAGEIEGTVAQNPIAMGKEAVNQVKRVLGGGKPEKDYVSIPHRLITKIEADADKGKLWADELRGAK